VELEEHDAVIEERTDGVRVWAEIKINRDIATLILLSLKYKIDLRILIYLYEKFREDVFFFFFLLAGQSVRFPTHRKLLRIVEAADEVVLGKSELGLYSKFLKNVLSVYNYDGEKIEVPLNDRKLFCLGIYGDMDGGDGDGSDSENS